MMVFVVLWIRFVNFGFDESLSKPRPKHTLPNIAYTNINVKDMNQADKKTPK